MTSARPGPFWDGPSSLVALVSEGGRVRPWRFPVDPDTGRAAGAPERLVDGDIAAWTLGVAGGVVSIVATVDDRPMELLVLEPAGPRPALARADHARRVMAAAAAVAGDAPRPGARRRRPDRDVDRLAGRRRDREAAGRREHPRRPAGRLVARAVDRERAPRVARLPRHPAEHPRLGWLWTRLDPPAARGLGRRRRRGRPRRGRSRRGAGAGRSGPARRAGTLLRRVHGQLAGGRRTRSSSRPPSARTAFPTR